MAAASQVEDRTATGTQRRMSTQLARQKGVNPSSDPTGQLRVLSVLRLSVATDETTSPERQRAANASATTSLSGQIIGEAVDLGISASKTTPFERPELGTWLAKPALYDALVFWRLDRAVRSMGDMNMLTQWANEHQKIIVFEEGPGGRLTLNFQNGVDLITQLTLQIFAFAAEFEAQSIRERVTGAKAAMRQMDLRWAGGHPKYGYIPAPLEGGGWTLQPAFEAIEGAGPAPVAVIERIIREFLGNPALGIPGKGKAIIAKGLNRDGIPSPRDWWSLVKGKQTGGKTGAPKGTRAISRKKFQWSATVVDETLRNPALIGWKTHEGKPVRGAEGQPVMMTDQPILTRPEYDRISAEIAARSVSPPVRKDTKALLIGVIHCAECGSRMHTQAQKKNGIYRDSSHTSGRVCAAPSTVRADWADEYVEREFLAALGGLRYTRTVETPGYDPALEIAEVIAELEEHQIQRDRRKSKAGMEVWQRHTDALDARLATLEATPVTPARREVIDTGRTYADEWAEADTAGRRRMLLDAGVRVTVKKGSRGRRRQLDESRMTFEITDEFHARAAEDLEGAWAPELAA